jgi:hypothetical protein
MKKTMFILTTVLLFGILSSCSKTDELTVKKNWIFTITTVTTTNGVPSQPLSVPEEYDNLTEIEAEAARLAAETTAQTQANELAQTQVQLAAASGMTLTVTMKVTVTKAVKP